MFSRRHFIAGAAATALAPAILRAQSLWRHYPFSLGIASGDPAPDGAISKRATWATPHGRPELRLV